MNEKVAAFLQAFTWYNKGLNLNLNRCEIKVKLTEKTGEIEFRIVEGSDPFIQLQSLLASFVLAGLGKE